MFRTKLLWLNATAFVLGFGATWYGIGAERTVPTLVGLGVMIACSGMFWMNWRRG